MRATRSSLAAAISIAAAFAFGQDCVPGQLIVKFKGPLRSHARLLRKLDGRILASLGTTGAELLSLRTRLPLSTLIARMRANPEVAYAEPNYVLRLCDVDDPLYPNQWNLRKVFAPQAWAITTGSSNVLVAVLDTGADLHHPDLAAQIADSRNFVGLGPADDGNGHGTHTAGTVAALTDNGIGVASLGYRTHLLIGKISTDQGQSTIATVISGIAWAESEGAKVISMSFATSQYSVSLRDAVDEAWSHGIVLVAAAGNNGTTQKMYPAAYASCIAVAATDANDRRAYFSTFGDWVHIAAPGVNILSLYKRAGTAIMSGTSMAAPQVAALAALLWANGARSNLSIRIAIENSGDPTAGFGTYPALRINARRALLRLP